MEKVKIKTVTYSPSNGEPEENSGFDPFYGGTGENLIPFPRDRIKPWWDKEDETRRSIIKKRYVSGPDKDETNATWWDLQYDTYKSLGGRLPFDLFKDMMLGEGDIGDLDYGARREIKEGIGSLFTKADDLETKKYLGGFLVPYGYREEEILKMPLEEIEKHLQEVMSL